MNKQSKETSKVKTMENTNVNINVSIEKKKSNAAWICGLIGFITSLPNSLCALLCAATVTGAAAINAGVTKDGAGFDQTAANVAAEEASNNASGLLWAVL